jgi:hypothetical protein
VKPPRIVTTSAYCHRLPGRRAAIHVTQAVLEEGDGDLIIERNSLDPEGEWREIPIRVIHRDPERPPTAGRRGGRRG